MDCNNLSLHKTINSLDFETIIISTGMSDISEVLRTITIYDFSLDRVVEIDASGYTTWDGYNEFGDPVANGMYICNYVHSNNKSYHFNIMVINK